MAGGAGRAQDYEIIIRRSSGWVTIPWRDFWEYRDLLVLLVRRDFVSRYKQTMLGPLWFLLQPVITTVIFTIVFGGVAQIPTDGIPRPLFYLCGLLGWTYFAQNLGLGGSVFISNANLFGKVWFPRLIVPFAVIVSNLVAVGLSLIPFATVYIYYAGFAEPGAISFTPLALLAPFVLLQIALLSLGVSLWMSAATAKYRDLTHLTQYIIQLWMFATPVFYPLSQFSEKWKWVAWINPMSVPIEALRLTLLGRGSLGVSEVWISLASTMLILVSGIAIFQRVERTVVDSV